MDNESDYFIEQKFLKNDIQSIEIEKLMLLIEFSEKRICKIESKDGNHGTGFFCIFQYLENWDTYNLLITNEHVLNERDLSPGSIVKFSTNNGKNNFEIKIDDKRTVYTSKEYDTSIIEIKPEDGLGKDAFFEIDGIIVDENYKEILKGKPLYFLYYPKGKDMQSSNGSILSINKDNFTFAHTCNSSEGSDGGPLIDLTTLKVIGLHKGRAKEDQNYNLGSIVKVPIEIFGEKIKREKKDLSNTNENEELYENERINENEGIYENEELYENKEKNENEIIIENEETNENENENENLNENEELFENEKINENEELNENGINGYENNNNEEKNKENVRELKDDNANNNVPLGNVKESYIIKMEILSMMASL